MKDRGDVLLWLGSVAKGADHLAELAARGPTFSSLGGERLDGFERGRRRGRGKPYSDTTIASMRRGWEYKVRPESGPVALEHRPADLARIGDLRLGRGPQPPPGPAQPAAPRRTPTQ
jgi:hypothetical protein